MAMNKLPRSFYIRPTLTVAKNLLGKSLVRKTHRTTLIGKIVEVEAYLGDQDPASHAYRGKTKRNDVMFWEGGHLYVYFTYGMHYCANVVTGPPNVGHAVLLRALEPIDGMDFMKAQRGSQIKDQQLTDGPAKLCEALAIDARDNGADLLGETIFITEGENIPRSQILSSSRIGITRAIAHRWRFYIRDNPWVSR